MTKLMDSGFGRSRIVAALLCCAVACVLVADLAQATWYSHGSTSGEATFGTNFWASNDLFSHGSGTADTRARFRCNPCPTCVHEPQVNYSYTITALDSSLNPVGSVSSNGIQHWCECPTDPIDISIPVTANPSQLSVVAKVTCGCCDDQGWVWNQTLESAHNSEPSIGITLYD